MHHFKTLELNPSDNPSHEDIQRAYRKRALTAHPDRPTGSNEEFKKVREAMEALVNEHYVPRVNVPTSRSRFPGPTPAQRKPLTRPQSGTTATRKKSTAALPPKWKMVRAPFDATLSNGAIYRFDIAPSSFGLSELRHGDIVCMPSGQRGCVVGVAADQKVYWWKKDSTTAEVLCTVLEKCPCERIRPATYRADPPIVPSSNANVPVARAEECTLTKCEELEERRRTHFLRTIDLWWDEARWCANLPKYAPLDRQFNNIARF